MLKTKEYKIKVKQWLTKPDFTKGNPIPMRIMFGIIERETAKAYYINVHGKPEPSSICLHCGRELTHPVSLLYGIGPICGGHFHINPLNSEEELNAAMEEIKQKLADTTWKGWIPKSGVEFLEETGEEVEIEDSSQKEKETNDKSSKEEKSKSQPAEQLKNENKKEEKSKYQLDITENLVNDLFSELEKSL